MIKEYINLIVEETFELAEKVFDRKFDRISIRFDLKGSTAGIFGYKNFGSECYLKFNVRTAELNQNIFHKTVIHELGHYFTHIIHGFNRKLVKPHGVQWKNVMYRLGYKPERCHEMKFEPGRKMQQFDYKCECQTFQLSKIKHNKVLRGTRYSCPKCRTKLRRVL